MGGDTYSWNPDGSLDERVVDGETETFDWNVEGQLASVAGPEGTDSYTYGPDGGRVLRETPDGRTLYVAGHEVTASLDGTEVDAVRTYTFDGAAIATWSTGGGVDYLVTDHQGSVIASVPAGAADADAIVAYAPYGAQIDATGETATDRSWIGQIHDSSTDLAYLNARYYDPSAAVFISPDPKWDDRPRTHNSYSYGMNNPVTHSDPTGLAPPKRWPTSPFQIGYWAGKALRTSVVRVTAAAAGVFNGAVRATAAAAGVFNGAATRLHQASQGVQKLATFAVRHRNAATLKAMHRANPDPGFWRALSAAGSASALRLQAMHADNPDPGFWRAVNSFANACSRDRGSTCTSGQVASYGRGVAAAEAARRQRAINAARTNTIASEAGGTRPDTASVGATSGACVSGTSGWLLGGDFSYCSVTTPSGSGSTFSVGVGVSSPGASVLTGPIVSNAGSLDDLAGKSECYSGDGGAGAIVGGNVCFGLDENNSYNGVVTIYGGVGAGVEPGIGGAYFGTHTSVMAGPAYSGHTTMCCVFFWW